jgi:hypothetical protein
MSETQAIPKTLNLGVQKPASIPAYTRRVISLATNAQTFKENDLANIILDTSTPGSFLDPTQSFIQFDLQITNSNPYIDYANFSSCGAGALIQEFRIVCQGTPIEEILDYNTMFEMWMDFVKNNSRCTWKIHGEKTPFTPPQNSILSNPPWSIVRV